MSRLREREIVVIPIYEPTISVRSLHEFVAPQSRLFIVAGIWMKWIRLGNFIQLAARRIL